MQKIKEFKKQDYLYSKKLWILFYDWFKEIVCTSIYVTGKFTKFHYS